MKFKFKALVVAAVAAASMSGTANALTNNDMFLIAYDSSAQKTYVRALGDFGSVTGFNGSVTQSLSLAADSNWSSFYSAGTASSVTWSVLGVSVPDTDGYGVPQTGDALVFTQSPTAQAPGRVSQDQITAVSGDLGSGIMATLYGLTGTGSSSTLISSSIGSGAGTDFFSWISTINTATTLGSESGFYRVTRSNDVDNTFAPTRFTSDTGLFADTVRLTAAGDFTYTNVAEVPEAGTSAMMLAGIGLMGFIARRRKSI